MMLHVLILMDFKITFFFKVGIDVGWLGQVQLLNLDELGGGAGQPKKSRPVSCAGGDWHLPTSKRGPLYQAGYATATFAGHWASEFCSLLICHFISVRGFIWKWGIPQLSRFFTVLHGFSLFVDVFHGLSWSIIIFPQKLPMVPTSRGWTRCRPRPAFPSWRINGHLRHRGWTPLAQLGAMWKYGGNMVENSWNMVDIWWKIVEIWWKYGGNMGVGRLSYETSIWDIWGNKHPAVPARDYYGTVWVPGFWQNNHMLKIPIWRTEWWECNRRPWHL